MGRVQGKVAIVTGAAKGIGAASAKALAREGAKVICSDMDEEGGEAMAAEIQRTGGEAIFVAHDVTDEAQWANVVKVAEDRFGGLNIVVNNAGIAPTGGPIEDLELNDWRKLIAVDLDSVFLGCKYGIKTIKKSTEKGQKGSIINISSINGQKGQMGQTNYSAAKAGVIGFTKALAQEVAKKGVTVNVIAPGYIDTEMVAAVPPKVLESIIATIPVGRLGKAEEIAHCVTFLADEKSAFITGATFTANGAQYIAG